MSVAEVEKTRAKTGTGVTAPAGIYMESGGSYHTIYNNNITTWRLGTTNPALQIGVASFAIRAWNNTFYSNDTIGIIYFNSNSYNNTLENNTIVEISETTTIKDVAFHSSAGTTNNTLRGMILNRSRIIWGNLAGNVTIQHYVMFNVSYSNGTQAENANVTVVDQFGGVNATGLTNASGLWTAMVTEGIFSPAYNKSFNEYNFTARSVDAPEVNETLLNLTASQTLPMTIPYWLYCGINLDRSWNMTKDLNCPEDGITINADNITLDCKNYRINYGWAKVCAGEETANGIIIYSTNTSIQNCNISGSNPLGSTGLTIQPIDTNYNTTLLNVSVMDNSTLGRFVIKGSLVNNLLWSFGYAQGLIKLSDLSSSNRFDSLVGIIYYQDVCGESGCPFNNYLLNISGISRSTIYMDGVNLTIQWYARGNVTFANGTPSNGATVNATNNGSETYDFGTTDANGLTPWVVVNDTKLGTEAGTLIYSLYNLTATFGTRVNNTQSTITETKTIPFSFLGLLGKCCKKHIPIIGQNEPTYSTDNRHYALLGAGSASILGLTIVFFRKKRR